MSAKETTGSPRKRKKTPPGEHIAAGMVERSSKGWS
jgi:hypothetical protein